MLPSYFNDPRTQSSEASTNPAPTASAPIGWDRTATTGGPDWANRPEGPAGATLGEFVIISELGRGSFGRVFLCRQPSLDRLVAVKASWAGRMGETEGVALAGLEHDHIVKVYSGFIDAESGWHCLCLQYVPGADLAAVIAQLHDHRSPEFASTVDHPSGGPPRTPAQPATQPQPQSGRDLLTALDEVSRGESGFDPAALRDREALARDDFPQAVCRLGGKLAEALAFAHARGVFHCDIKPANILLTPYGRPMLADFNVSFDATRRPGGAGLGGTIAYMAPEHQASLRGEAVAMDARCDIYSLGVVLHELATGVRPDWTADPDPLDRVPRELAAVIRRCLERDPARRYQSAGELAAALASARHLIGIRRALPRPRALGRWTTARPVRALAVAGLFPHFVASAVNITYNTVNIHLSDAQHSAFMSIVIVYNLIVYPTCGMLLFGLLQDIGLRLPKLPRMDGPAVDDLRRRVRRFGWWAITLGAAGWLPGALIFPLGIDWLAGGVGWPVYAHYAVSFVLSGLVGVVFSYLAVELVVFRALLPRLGNPDAEPARCMWDEVHPLTAPFGPFLILACAVPLTGAVLLVALADGSVTLGFRLLVAGLIGLGAAGVGLAERMTRRLHRLAAVWEPPPEHSGPASTTDFTPRDTATSLPPSASYGT